MKPCIRYFSLIIITACTGTIRADDKPQAKGEPNHIQWELNTLDAFVKAVEEEKPLVVVFLANPKDRYENQRNLSNDFQVVLNSKELLMFKGKAIFAKGFAHEDEYARRMASHLKLTVYPTVSIIEPRTDALTECYRMEGFFNIKEVVQDLKMALPAGVSAERRKVLFGNFNEAPSSTKEAATSLEEEKKAIEQSVRSFEAAFKAGDLNQFLKLTSEPDKTKLRFTMLTLCKVGDAKRIILAAMDSKWGRQNDSIPYGADDEKLQKRMARVETLKIRSMENVGKMSATLYIDAHLTTGKTESWKVYASKQSEQWKLLIHQADNQDALILSKEAEKSLDQLAGLYQQLAREILDGRYESREAVKEAARRAYQTLSRKESQPGARQGSVNVQSKEAEPRRLAVAQALSLFAREEKPSSTPGQQQEEAKPLSDSDKSNIREVVKKYADALKAADFDQIVNLSAGAYYNVSEDGFRLAKSVGEAKRKMLAAMDRQYGQKDEFFPFGVDDTALQRRMKQVSQLTVLDFDTALGKMVTMNVDARLSSGVTEKWKLVAHRFGDTWRIWPRTVSVLADLGTTEVWQKQMKTLVKAYDAISVDILSGKYSTRTAAYEAGYSAYAKIMGEDDSQIKIKIDPKLFSGSESRISPALVNRVEEALKSKNGSPLSIQETHDKIDEIRSGKSAEQKTVDEKDDLGKAQDAIKQLHAVYLEGAQLMNMAKDEASAVKVKSEFPRLDRQFADISKVLKSHKLTNDQQRGLMLMFQEKMEPAKEAFASAFRQLHAERPAAYRILADAELIKVGEANLEAIAQSDIMRIKLAITIYYQANRHWPASLESLKKYHEGSVSDPWGKPYQFEIVNVTGEKDDRKSTPYVWTISQFGDGKKVIGTRPTRK